MTILLPVILVLYYEKLKVKCENLTKALRAKDIL